jgi:hypothetical protein
MKKNKEAMVIGDVLEQRALALPASEVQRNLHIDPLTAKRAVSSGLGFVSTRKPALAKLFPGADLGELMLLPALCDHLALAQKRVAAKRRRAGPSLKRPLIADSLSWRRKLMSVGASLVSSGQVGAEALQTIREGRGTLDGVTDVVSLVTLLTPYRSVVEATFGVDALKKASASAKTALAALGSQEPADEAAADLRDRFATLITRGHDRLRTAVAVLSSYSEAADIVGSLVKHSPHKPKTAPATPA